jgi:predicted phage-related endonuclease
MNPTLNLAERRSFIGGSDARIIMGEDETALLRLWKEKRGEPEPQDLSGDLLVQLGTVTERLNRHWYEKNTGQVVTDVQRGGRLAKLCSRSNFVAVIGRRGRSSDSDNWLAEPRV